MTGKTEHSPLPWRMENKWGDDPRRAVDAEGRFVFGDSCGPSKKDAELIVAAVNAYGLLQSALSFALNSLEEITDPHVGYFITWPMHERAKQAMKCARAALGRETDDGQE